MNRRSVIGSIVAGAVVFSAGCLSRNDADNGDGSNDTDGGGDSDGSNGQADPDEDWRDDVSFEGAVDREVYVGGRRYDFTPGSEDPIRVEEGETVGIGFTSLDHGYHAGHGIEIPAFGVSLSATVGSVDSGTFSADETGEFEAYCNVPCSDGHSRMTGTVVVE